MKTNEIKECLKFKIEQNKNKDYILDSDCYAHCCNYEKCLRLYEIGDDLL